MASQSPYTATVIAVLQQLAQEGGTTLMRELLIDDQQGRYALFSIGWQGYTYVHTCLVHIDLINDKIWVQQDITEEGIAPRLVSAGIPPQAIVLAFYAPEERIHTEFAVN